MIAGYDASIAGLNAGGVNLVWHSSLPEEVNGLAESRVIYMVSFSSLALCRKNASAVVIPASTLLIQASLDARSARGDLGGTDSRCTSAITATASSCRKKGHCPAETFVETNAEVPPSGEAAIVNSAAQARNAAQPASKV